MPRITSQRGYRDPKRVIPVQSVCTAAPDLYLHYSRRNLPLLPLPRPQSKSGCLSSSGMFTDCVKVKEEGRMDDKRDVRHGNKDDFQTEQERIKEQKKKKKKRKEKKKGRLAEVQRQWRL